MNERFLTLSPEVEQTLRAGGPVVALESTVISHGMPYPGNVETALELEALVREAGAVPATIAILDHRICVGLTRAEIERLANGQTPVTKLSRRDLPIVLAQGGLGATTVAATMIAARMAGIQVFATGGIGGVHRGGATSFDISADLQELGRTSVAVVCAGAKSILDIGLTLEVLETLGVPVLGYGTSAFPAFYTPGSEFGVDARVDTAAEVAAICRTKWSLGLEGGVLVANPVPAEFAMDPAVIDAAIARALEAARAGAVTGKRVTPFLLAKVKELTGGDSLETNVALIRNNALLAGRIAVELAKGSAG